MPGRVIMSLKFILASDALCLSLSCSGYCYHVLFGHVGSKGHDVHWHDISHVSSPLVLYFCPV